MDAFFRDLGRPEYLHVLLNPVPVYGLAVALLGLAIAIFVRSRGGQVVVLALVLLCAASVWPVVHYGEAAESGVLAISDSDGHEWFETHEHRAKDLVWIHTLLVLISAAALVIPMKWPKSGRLLLVVTLVWGMVAMVAGGYIAHAGGKIRHKEFRSAPPPVPSKGETS